MLFEVDTFMPGIRRCVDRTFEKHLNFLDASSSMTRPVFMVQLCTVQLCCLNCHIQRNIFDKISIYTDMVNHYYDLTVFQLFYWLYKHTLYKFKVIMKDKVIKQNNQVTTKILTSMYLNRENNKIFKIQFGKFLIFGIGNCILLNSIGTRV